MSKGLTRGLAAARTKGGTLRPQVIPFDVTVNVADGAPGFGAAPIRGLPQGNILVLGAVSYVTFTLVSGAITNNFSGNYAIGTAPTVDNDVADAEEANVVASAAIAAATSGVSARNRGTGASASVVDNTAGDRELNLNVLIADGSISGAGVLRAQGHLYLVHVPGMGDD